MSLGGGGSTNVTSSGLRYPQWLDAAIKQVMSDALSLSFNAFSDYVNLTEQGTSTSGLALASPGVAVYSQQWNSFAQQDSNELAGLAAAVARATSGDLSVSKAKGLIANFLSNSYLNNNLTIKSNEYLSKVSELNDQFDEELEKLANFMASSDSFGGTVHSRKQSEFANKTMKALVDLSAVIYSDYKSSKAVMLNGIHPAIEYGQEAIVDADALKEVGKKKREIVQEGYEADYKAYEDSSTIPIKRLEIHGNFLRMMAASGSTNVEPVFQPSPWSQVAGLGMLALTAAGSYYSPSKKHLPDSTISPPPQPSVPAQAAGNKPGQ